jgi:PAS domain S-box-containing protein
MTAAKSHWLRGEPFFGSGSTSLVVCVTIALSYLVPHLIGKLTSNPQTVWPLWPGCAILVTGLLLVPFKIWPLLIPASFVGFAVADLQAGVPLSSIVRFIPGNTVEVLISAVGLRYCFDGVPRLNSVKALAKYSFFALVLAPFVGAFLSAHGIANDYWMGWKIVFLSEVLAFITLTPALLGWISQGRALMGRSLAYHVEGVILTAGLVLVSYAVFTMPENSRSPALFYALVPFLLWSALRFGWLGVSTSLVAVTFLSIWGAVYGRGPFSNMVPLTDPLPLQMFLIFAAIPFMVLSALAEEHEEAAHVVRKSEERLQLAQRAARIGSFERDIATGVLTWATGLENMYGLPPGAFEGKHVGFLESLIHPDDRGNVANLTNRAMKTGDPTDGEWRVIWPDGTVHWIAGRWQVFMDDSGAPSRMVGVNIDITVRKRAEEAFLRMNYVLESQTALLQSREELLNIFVKNVPAGVAMLDRDMRYLQVSERWCADYGAEAAQLLGRSHYEVFPDIPQRWKEIHRRALEGETFRTEDDRWDRQSGLATWVHWEIRPWKSSSGNIGGILIFSEDITQRKQMEEALSGMSRKLIESQEQERARIGRELHDDINQRLAMLGIELEQLTEEPSEISRRVQELRTEVADISNDVQALSHELHSSKLEYLGVVAGIESWCKEFGGRQRMEIDFKNEVSSALPFEIGLSLFRVVQEALHNAQKHSGVKRVEVQLTEQSNEVCLTIGDSGKGFDTEAARQSTGLGLTSMRERVGLVNGTISIESKPMGGTTIHVHVPLASEHEADRAAG